MRPVLRVFSRDLAELALRRGLLALVLVAPLALLLLIGQLRVHEPVTTVALVQTADPAARPDRLRDALSDLRGIKLVAWSEATGPRHERALAEGVDVVIEWSRGAWRFDTPVSSRYRLASVQEVVQDLALSWQRDERLQLQLEELAALREALPPAASAPAAASQAAASPPVPALARIDAMEQRLREEAEVPTPVLRSWLSSRLQSEFAPATRADHSLVPGFIALITVFLPFLLGSTAIVRERESGTLPTLLLATQLRWSTLAAGKLLLPLFVALLSTLVLCIAARSVFGFGIKPGFGEAVAVQALAALVSAVFGLGLSTMLPSSQDAYTASAVYLVALILLTGLVYPLQEAATVVAVVAHAFPLTLSGPPLEAWMQRGAAASTPATVWVGLGLQLLVATMTCAAAMRRLRERL